MWRCKSALNHECIWFESKSIAILRLTFMVTDSPCLLGNALICARRIHTHTSCICTAHFSHLCIEYQCRAIESSGIICKTREIPSCTCCCALTIPSWSNGVHFEHECVQDERFTVWIYSTATHFSQKSRSKMSTWNFIGSRQNPLSSVPKQSRKNRNFYSIIMSANKMTLFFKVYSIEAWCVILPFYHVYLI